MIRRLMTLLCCLLAACQLQGCAASADAPPESPQATMPVAPNGEVAWSRERFDEGEDGALMLRVYVADAKRVEPMEVEAYLQGVVAGEMKNDWPLEALKAQAILARTYVTRFVGEKESRYDDAHISTDIEEAQAYDAAAVNDRVRQAVEETRGVVLSSGGTLPYGWFHAHSGGMTALAREGLGWTKAEPAYTRVVEGAEPDAALASRLGDALDAGYRDAEAWEATFPYAEFNAACQRLGKRVSANASSRLRVGERGQSGRAVTLLVDGQTLDAAELRIALGSSKLRSTLLTSFKATADGVYMAGKGYGHGVGMSQWGAYALAKQGQTAEDIIGHYFEGVTLARLWE